MLASADAAGLPVVAGGVDRGHGLAMSRGGFSAGGCRGCKGDSQSRKCDVRVERSSYDVQCNEKKSKVQRKSGRERNRNRNRNRENL